MEVVGRRHDGRKALPAGGGGGKSPTRELLDTLLLWNPSVQLDENGKATLTVPLNDSITRYTLVAVADYGAHRFGTGQTSIASTQDLQLISRSEEHTSELQSLMRISYAVFCLKKKKKHKVTKLKK